MSSALSGIKVLDFSTRLSAAWAARLFGDYGADVVMVEEIDGHPLRSEPPFTEDGVSILHAYANWNKRSISRSTVSEQELYQLVDLADVIVVSEVDSSLLKHEFRDDQVILSITPHGLTGPLKSEPGNNLTACSRVGWSAINACEGESPLQLPHNQTGYIAGIAGYVGASAIVFRVLQGGPGDLVDVSEMEAMSNTCAPWAQVGNFIGGNRMAHGPNGRRTRSRPGPLWQCENGPINFGYGDWREWQKAFHFLGKPEIAEDPNFIPALGRHQKDTRPVRDGLADAIANRDKWEIFHGLADVRCISGVVQDAKELVESDHLNAREFLVKTSVRGREIVAPGAFCKLSATPLTYERSAPETSTNLAGISWRSQSRDQSYDSYQLPLVGIRVLTFTQAWSGTFATQILALLGADVVQIEARKRPDVWRGAGAPVPPAIRRSDIAQNPLNTNGMYNSVNLNKRAITLDVTSPEGKKIFWDLVPKFDVIADNFSPHVMTNWGVSLESLREVNPSVIFASLSGYGRTGPLSEYPANGATTEPMAGLASIHGYEGDTAQNTGGLIPDPISGFYFASAIISALIHRHETGEGQQIDLSMIESVAIHVGDAIMDYSANGIVRKPSGNRHPRIAPHSIFPTAGDEWLALACESEEAFRALASIAKLDYFRFDSEAVRKDKEDELNRFIRNWTLKYPIASLEAQLRGSGITFSRVYPFQDIYANPGEQFLSRRFLVSVDHPESGRHFMPTNPWIYKNTEKGEIHHSPCFGQHSHEVFKQDLNLDFADYEDLESKGITGTTRL